MAGRLDGRVAVVTGSGQSIGRAIALLLAREGAAVVVNSRRERNTDDTPTARDTLAAIRDAGGTATAVFADVGTARGCEAIIGAAVGEYGRVDILVNNAGGGRVKAMVDTTDDEWAEDLAGNLTSQFRCARLAVPGMSERGWGRIINIGSSVGVFGMPSMTSYAASKAGVIGFTLALAQELEGAGITCNYVLPSATTVRNDRTRAERERQTGHVASGSPWRTPEAVAPLVVHLCSDAAGRCNGQVIYVAGGQITRYVWPPQAMTMVKPGHWTLDELDELLPRYFGHDLPAPSIPPSIG
jgi:3-oxoacyl-[acyl-carrier protein] reductase